MEALESLLLDLESRESDLLSCCSRIENISSQVDRVDEESREAISEPRRKPDEIQVPNEYSKIVAAFSRACHAQITRIKIL
jgi:hypothetical protein